MNWYRIITSDQELCLRGHNKAEALRIAKFNFMMSGSNTFGVLPKAKDPGKIQVTRLYKKDGEV